MTTLDPNIALVVIDVLKGIVKFPTVHPAASVTEKVVKLTDAFRGKSKKVVLVKVGWSADFGDAVRTRTQAPPPGARPAGDFFDYLDELKADPARDIFITKRQWGAFYGTDLDLQLRRRGITQIVLCGIATSIGVESSARDAWERSYNITFASDAMTDMNADAHDRALNIIFPRLGEIGTTDEILSQLSA